MHRGVQRILCSPCPFWGLCSSIHHSFPPDSCSPQLRMCSPGCWLGKSQLPAKENAGKRDQSQFCALPCSPFPFQHMDSLSVISSTALRHKAVPGMALLPKYSREDRSCLESKPNICTPELVKLSRAPGELWGIFPAVSPRILCPGGCRGAGI